MRTCLIVGLLAFSAAMRGDGAPQNISEPIPRVWDDAEISALEIPLTGGVGSPKHVPASYYYRIPVRPIFKSYDVYAPGREPRGYMAQLESEAPVILWDGSGHAPSLKSESDWIKAGEMVFDSAVVYDGITTAADVRSADWYAATGTPLTRDGIMPFYRYVIREKGKLELGRLACANCHTRVMPDGTTLKGAQGNIPFDRFRAYAFRSGRFKAQEVYALERQLFAAPWSRSDPGSRVARLSVEAIADAHQEIPPGVLGRHRSSPFEPVQVPSLIGVKEVLYLDRTGLQPNRSMVDLMRYAALNQGADDLASFDGFVPIDLPLFQRLPEPADRRIPGRYSDEQLYAMARYLYSLRPPANPNKLDAAAVRGQKIFAREGCAGCHTPPLYTNNKLTPVEGFAIPEEHRRKYAILSIPVGTDAGLALYTRRGTGYYKVPSLRGLWYRTMFPHDGSCATLEDWFDARRTRDDYVPTGFKGYGRRTRAVKGHRFGLGISPEEKRELLAFLRTL